jgi:CRP/FNR family transcriptional regulator, cyclic AMP receptor protein
MDNEKPSIRIETYPKGTTIIREGDLGESAYVINKGYVEVLKKVTEDKSSTITKLGPGEIFGEMALFGDKKRTATVITISQVELKVIDKCIFEDELKRTPPLIRIILQMQNERLKKASNNIAALRLLFNKEVH